MSEGEAREVMDAEQTAEFLGVAPQTVRSEARAGRLPGRRVGKEWRFSRTVLIDWLAGDPEHPDQRYGRRRRRHRTAERRVENGHAADASEQGSTRDQLAAEEPVDYDSGPP